MLERQEELMAELECPRCEGVGELEPCPRCDGVGRYEYNPHHPYSSPDGDKEEECPDCSGTGISCCPSCLGTGMSKPSRSELLAAIRRVINAADADPNASDAEVSRAIDWQELRELLTREGEKE